MPFGHHGANHPVQDLTSGEVMITSQNHGFAVDEDSLPVNVQVTHRSLFDQTVQGIELQIAQLSLSKDTQKQVLVHMMWLIYLISLLRICNKRRVSRELCQNVQI